jgi:phosphoenolpyruvate synthase/pyruvate phosphate dikinase
VDAISWFRHVQRDFALRPPSWPRLVSIAAAEGRTTKHSTKLGICGEHGGNPESIHFLS